MRWASYIQCNGTNLAGFVFSDTADAEIVQDAFSLQAYRADGTWLRNYDTSNLKVTYSKDGKSFEFVIPDYPGVGYWTLAYYTKVVGEVDKPITTNNTATLTSEKKETWSVSAVGTGTPRGKTEVNKTGTGYTKNEDGTVSFHWDNEVQYNNVNIDTYTIADTIRPAQIRRYTTNASGNSWSYWDRNAYSSDHFGIASEIKAQLEKTLRITIQNENGEEETLTYDQAKEKGTVAINFYVSSDKTKGVSGTDSTTRMRYFTISVGGGLKPVKVTFQYDTRFDTIHYAKNTRWQMENLLSANGVEKTPTQQYFESLDTTTGSISKQVRTSGDMWTDKSYTFDYDAVEGLLTFRILATVADGQTEMHITDTLPEGYTIVDGSVQVGNYYKDANRISVNWTANENASVVYPSDENGNKLTVDLNNIGTALKLRDDKLVVVQYQVKVDEDFETMEGATVNFDGKEYTSSKTFTNKASNGEIETSLDTKITRTEKILSKTGEQIEQNGAYTSRVHYTVEVNPSAADLIEGSDELTLTDTMTSTELDFKLDATSISLYLMAEDGSKLGKIDPLSIKIQQPEENGDTLEQTFEIGVKDATAYILEYDFIADKREATSAATSGDFVNTISLIGYASDEDTTNVKGINVRASSNHAGLQLVKVDEANNAKFLDATFTLEKYNGSTYELVDTFTMSGENGELFDYYASNCTLEGGKLYRIVETSAPDGYKLDTTPFYFIIRGHVEEVRTNSIEATNLQILSEDEAKAEAGAPSGLDIHMLQPNSNSYFEITNEKAPATGKVVLEAKKHLEGRNLKDGEFSFTVKEGDKVVATGTNDANGDIKFSEIPYAAVDVGTHNYTITEDSGSVKGVTYSTESMEVKVTVTDDGGSTLKTDVDYPKNGTTFTNKYEAKGDVVLTAKKHLEGRDLKGGEFSFTVKDGNKVVATGKNDANGDIKFSAISYSLTDVGTHNYTITEDGGNASGVTYSTEEYTVTVTVSDNEDGTLKVEEKYPESGVVFHNTYDTEAGKLVLEGTKELTGRDLKDGEFAFTVTENGQTVATGSNDAEGNITFTEIEYKLEDVGTHTLNITEDEGDKGGVEYSKESYTVTVTVSDNGDGTLLVDAVMPEEGIVFHNGYTAKGVTVTLGAKKNYTGATLKDGQFSFVLKDADGQVVETVTNKANGSVSFTQIRYTEAGVYKYTVSEVKGNQTGVTYDNTIYNVTITVTDDGEGRLLAAVDTEDKSLVFTNKYTSEKTTTSKKTTKSTSGAKTGDAANAVLWLGVLLISGAACGIVVKRRKNSK